MSRNQDGKRGGGRRRIFAALAVFTAAGLAAGCGREPPARSGRAGVALTFDDHSLEEWHAARPLFQRYQARATFFIDHFTTLSEGQLEMLADLAADGHEIGSHSCFHVNANVYLARNPGLTMEDYVRDQVLPSVEAMRAAGYEVPSFSHPGGWGPPEGDPVLLRHFRMVRTNNRNDCFHPLDGRRVIGADNIDHLFREDRIMSRLRRALEEDQVLVLFGHRIGPEPGMYYTTLGNLERVLRFVRDHGMRFYGFSELADAR